MIIAISGKIGSGKTTTTDFLIKNLKDYNFKKKSFGYNVKKICSILTGHALHKFKSREGKSEFLEDWGVTIGQIQPLLAEDCIRKNLNDDAWILSLFATYNNNCNWIIDDLRYKNEFSYLKNHNAILIRLNGDPYNLNASDSRSKNHKSEIDLDDCKEFDIYFKNEPPIENLNRLLELVLLEIKKREL